MKWKVNPRVTKGIVVGLCVGAAAAGRGGSGGAPAAAAAKLPPLKLIELAGKDPNGPQFRDALVATLGEDRIKSGRAVTGEGPDFLWAIETSGLPQLIIDDAVGPAMTQIQGTDLWFQTGRLATGKNHTFYYLVGGKRVGGDVNLPAYGPESYEHPGVPKGTLSPMIT